MRQPMGLLFYFLCHSAFEFQKGINALS